MAKIETKLRRPYRKRYAPSDMTHAVNLDSRHRVGKPIEIGAIVTVTHHYGPFRRIVDEAGNEMSVGRYSLVPTAEPHQHQDDRRHRHLGQGGREYHTHTEPFDGHSLAGVRYHEEPRP